MPDVELRPQRSEDAYECDVSEKVPADIPPARTDSNVTAQFIILGAGRPFRGDRHSALHETAGQRRVLDWVLHAARQLSAEACFVGGYHVDEVLRRYPDLNYIVNPDWDTTGPAASLLLVPADAPTERFVSYADIVFRDSTLNLMATVDADIVVAVDTAWRGRFSGRSEQDLKRCEKVRLAGGLVTRLGADIEPDFAEAEFIGLVRLRPAVVALLSERRTSFLLHFQRARLSELIEHLRADGLVVAAVDVSGDWAELNQPRDLAHFVLGTKAQTLQRLQGIVRLSRIEDQLHFTVTEWRRDADAVLTRAARSFRRQHVVVRSSAMSEDAFDTANAGVYKSVLDIDPNDRKALCTAISNVVASYPDDDPLNQVLIQPMVADVRASGVVFTRTLTSGAPYYVISYDDVSGSTETITNGSSREQKTLVVHRAANGLSGSVLLDRLLPAVREVEQLLDYDSLDLEFAIGEHGLVHIFQVRPIAVDHGAANVADEHAAAALADAKKQFIALQAPRPFVLGRRTMFGVMPDWNPAEIIGTRPGRLAQSLYRFLITDEIWAMQRAEYGYRDVRPQPLLVSFAGQPYVDVRASFNSFVPADLDDGLAGRLVDFYLDWLAGHLELHDKVEFEVVPTCYGLDFPAWRQRLHQDGGFSAAEIDRLEVALRTLTRRALDRNRDELAAVEKLEARFAPTMAADLAPLDRAALLLEDCRRYGTLPFAHLARSAFVAVTLLRSAVRAGVIPQSAVDGFLHSVRTVTHALAADAAAVAAGGLGWQAFVDRYGHLRPGTYDIASASYREDPERFLRPIVHQATKTTVPADAGEWTSHRTAFAKALNAVGLGVDVEGIEGFMRTAIEGREYAKFAFSRNLSAAMDALAAYGTERGVTREALVDVPLEALAAIRTGDVPALSVSSWLAARAAEGARARAIAAHVELPPLLIAERDFDLFLHPHSQPNFIGSGRITAPCVDLDSEAAARDLHCKIVLIPQADPGYDWLFAQGIAGLITMYGGANSHIAIRAAEFRLPAAIGVGRLRYEQLVNATVLDLDAGNRSIRVL